MSSRRLFVIFLLIHAATLHVVSAQSSGPTVTAPSQARPGSPSAARNGIPQYPWHLGTRATIFWIGERPTARNPTPNNKSSWDTKWQENYGGYDNPDPAQRNGFLPKGFTPGLNPFYIALPYNDVINHREHKPEASKVIPWFHHKKRRPGTSVCRGRWIQMVRNGKVCYAQWEDCGPFNTIDWEYVFLNKKPINPHNGGAGIDISPAVRDYFGMKSGQQLHWRFVEFADVPRGPWSLYGTNNPFVNPKAPR